MLLAVSAVLYVLAFTLALAVRGLLTSGHHVVATISTGIEDAFMLGRSAAEQGEVIEPREFTSLPPRPPTHVRMR